MLFGFVLSHVRLVLHKEYGNPVFDEVDVALRPKKELERVIRKHPVRKTSQVLLQELEDIASLASSSVAALSELSTCDDLESLESIADLGDLAENEAYLEAKAEGFTDERVFPVSVYFDGVQYTNNESFLGFFVTNLKTRRQHLLWVIRHSSLFSVSLST